MKRFFILLTLLIVTSSIEAQDSTKSLAFKDNKPERRSYFFYQPDLSYQIWQEFKLIKEANAGDPLAQHELGIRYFLGEGAATDTLKGAYWMKKAADQNLTSACYNYGILLLNGWGVPWNPFEAFKYFYKAAVDGMPQAQYIAGLFYTDNLILKRNWNEAYKWIKKSSESNYEPAEHTLKEILEKVPASSLDTSSINGKKDSTIFIRENDNSLPSPLGLVFIDFDNLTDSVSEVDDKRLLEDLALIPDDSLKNLIIDSVQNLKISNLVSLNEEDLEKYAEAGSPEALTILGRFHEKGIHFKKDQIKALFYYLRAVRNDSPASQLIIYKIELEVDFFIRLKALIDSNDPEAMFTWYALKILGYDSQISDDDAVQLLLSAAALNHLPSIAEAGLLHYTGRNIQSDKIRAEEIWKAAAARGSIEAKVRLLAIKILDKSNLTAEDFSLLEEYIKKGSLFAQFLAGYCFEKGIAVIQSKAEAVKYYRAAAQRGNRLAYQELKRIYDEIRPDDEQFQVSN